MKRVEAVLAKGLASKSVAGGEVVDRSKRTAKSPKPPRINRMIPMKTWVDWICSPETVELKAVEHLPVHLAPVLSYPKLGGLRLELLIFNVSRAAARHQALHQ
jgi:hypothetical protein